MRDRFEARDVGGEAGDRNTRVVMPDQLGQRPAQIRLRTGRAGPQRVGRVADHRQDTLVAEPAQRILVGRQTDQRVGVELPVAGMQHRAGGGAQHNRVGLGDRMGQGDELEIERTDRKPARHRHDVDPHLVGEPDLDQLCPQHRGGERRRPDRAAQLRPQIRNGADVIFMRVGRDDAEQPVAALDDKAPGRASRLRGPAANRRQR